MGRYGQLVMGPAGAGKSTYCAAIERHCENAQRRVHVVNLDPAAEHFDYPVALGPASLPPRLLFRLRLAPAPLPPSLLLFCSVLREIFDVRSRIVLCILIPFLIASPLVPTLFSFSSSPLPPLPFDRHSRSHHH